MADCKLGRLKFKWRGDWATSTGYVIDDKRVYKLSDNTVLTGTKKIKTFKFARFTVPPQILPFIICKVYE